jgi:hypothetical protein
MPLTDASQVKEAGQLVYQFFEGLTSEADLTALINRWIAVADAFVYRRVGSSVYSDTTPQIVTMLSAAECYLTLAYLGTMFKARKTYGSHYPIDTEDSSSFHEFLEPEWRQLAMELIDEFAVLDEPGSAIALPAFLISSDVDETLAQSTPDDIRELLDEASGFTRRELPAVAP